MNDIRSGMSARRGEYGQVKKPHHPFAEFIHAERETDPTALHVPLKNYPNFPRADSRLPRIGHFRGEQYEGPRPT